MRRFRIAVVLAAVASFAIAGTAFAAKITGGTTTLTPSSAATTLLANNHITVTPVAPATASNGAFSFPIARGHINTKTLHGSVKNTGGVELSNGTRTVVARHLEVVSNARGAYVWALIRDHSSHVCYRRAHHPRHAVCVYVTRYRDARILKLSGGSVTNGTYTGNATITAATATLINNLAGSKVVSAGAPLGTISIAPTLS
jgi:hypothetical protein